jgi:hypothetical protein
MFILTPENKSYSMTELPHEVTEDLRYCVLDYSNQSDVDFFFIPLMFLDVFSRPAADLRIGRYRIMMPLDWSIMIADKNFGYIETIELNKINDRDFEVFIMNPCSGYMPEFQEISIENIFPDYSWNMPRMKFGHILAVPLSEGPEPPCAFFVKDTNKLPDVLDITKIFT